MRVLIIIPAYNEAGNIEKVVDNIIQNYPQYDYIVVNDASSDQTKEVCVRNGYCFLDQTINLGIGGTVQDGYQYALEHDYDVAVQLDGDGQHDVSYISEMLKAMEQEGAEVVIGSRFVEKEGFQSSGPRRMGIRILSAMIFLCTWKKVKDVTSGFRAVNRRFIEIYAKDYPQDYPEPEAIVAAIMHGGKVMEVPVIMRERISGVSSINLKKAVYYMIKVILALFICRISFGIRRK